MKKESKKQKIIESNDENKEETVGKNHNTKQYYSI